MNKEDLEDLRYAKTLLENPGFAAKLTGVLATPIEKGYKLLPTKWSSVVDFASQKSLQKALQFALLTLGGKRSKPSLDFAHKIAIATSGATGGAFGLAAIPIEMPVSTLIILRSIADIARSEGEELNETEVKLNCLQVFALGGKSAKDDTAETGYYAVRISLSKIINDAAKYISQKGTIKEGAPVLVKLISTIASRFGIVVSEKVAAMAIPAIGAVGGAMVNTLFIDHFQNMARGHFIVRRLERKYGLEFVKDKYKSF